MKEMMKIIKRYNLTPNEVFFLWYMKNKELNEELLNLSDINKFKSKGFLEHGLNNKWKLSIGSLELLDEVESCFKKTKTKIKIVVSEDMKLNIAKYRELWPKGPLPSGKRGRVNVRDLQDSFVWFFKNYDYTWDTVFLATKLYLDEYESGDNRFPRTSKYFITKSIHNQVRESELATYCERIIEGDINTENVIIPSHIF